MAAKKQAPIIVRRSRKRDHGGHHGGSWKVAYADFVTAMMAFFLVMWILSMDSATKDLVQGYFNNPVGFKKSYSGGTTPISAGNAPTHVDLKRMAMLVMEHQRREFENVKGVIQDRLAANPEIAALAGQVEIVVTEEGLRIELLESETGEKFFEVGRSTLHAAAAHALNVIADGLEELPNPVVIEGHTDARRYGPSATYTNWELSADRANTARRQLVTGGVGAERIVEVRGYADRALRLPSSPYDAANRRITILLPFNVPAMLGAGPSGLESLTFAEADAEAERRAAAALDAPEDDSDPAAPAATAAAAPGRAGLEQD